MPHRSGHECGRRRVAISPGLTRTGLGLSLIHILEVVLRLADKLSALFDPSPSHLHGTEPLIHGVTGIILGIDQVDAAFVVQLEEIVLTIEVVIVLRDTPMGEYLVERGDGVSN